MARREVLVDLDAASLLSDETPGPRPTLAVAAPERPRPLRSPPKIVVPKPAKKGRRDAGRDEMLSEYLSSLGRIPLLTPEQEKELASTFRDAEVRCWQKLLSADAVCAALAVHPILHDADVAVRAALGEGGPHDGLADALRDIDDDRALVDEMIGLLAGHAALKEALVLRRKALEVRNRFVRANLRLVVSVARRFHHYRLPLIDLIQEGNLGLIKSVHRFDHKKGFRFSTYAHWWIRQAIER
ncbi:MAG TPA: sigma-70 family RNA polymerase sigma factor, partial [Myxococcota bacterium]